MYRYSKGQISLTDFNQPAGMNLKENNRWVKKAQTIPWLEIEKRYAALFTNRKGNVAKPLRLALGTCIIQAKYGYSDEETVLQIQENPYLQYICGYPGYNDEKLRFDPSLIVYFRKRLTPEILGEINEMIVQDAKARQCKGTALQSDDGDDNSDGGSGTGGNSGTLIMDATCAPSNIRYPQDVSLLNEARENAEKLIPLMIHNATHDKALPVYGEGLNVRDWLYVKDHCHGILAVIEKGRVSEVYNLGGHNEKANIEIVRIILDKLGKPESLITYVADRHGHDQRYAIDPAKANEELGWGPTTMFKDGIVLTIDWHMSEEGRKWTEECTSGAYLNWIEKNYKERK